LHGPRIQQLRSAWPIFPETASTRPRTTAFAGVYQMCNDNNPDAKFNLCADNSDSGAVSTGRDFTTFLDRILGATVQNHWQEKKRPARRRPNVVWLIFHCNGRPGVRRIDVNLGGVLVCSRTRGAASGSFAAWSTVARMQPMADPGGPIFRSGARHLKTPNSRRWSLRLKPIKARISDGLGRRRRSPRRSWESAARPLIWSDADGGDGSGAGGVVRRVRSQLARRFGAEEPRSTLAMMRIRKLAARAARKPNEGDRQPLLLPDDGARCDAPPGQDATLQHQNTTARKMCHCLWVILALIGLCCSAGATPVVNLSQRLSPARDAATAAAYGLLNSGASITRFSSMPGGGWDNLRNKDMGLVADLSFTDCTLSDDGILRYRMYSSKLQPDFKLSVALTNRLTDIVSALVNNRTKLARLITCDFGTHVITSVEAGGILEKLDFFRSDSITDRNFMENKFSASMSFDAGGSTTVTKEDIDKYTKSVRKMMMRSFGGPILVSSPKLAADWMKYLHENLVPIDREGEPLYRQRDQQALPSEPAHDASDAAAEGDRGCRDALLQGQHRQGLHGSQFRKNFDPSPTSAASARLPPPTSASLASNQQCRESNPGAGIEAVLRDGNGLSAKPHHRKKLTCPAGYEPLLFHHWPYGKTLLGEDASVLMRLLATASPSPDFFACNSGNPLSEMNRRLVAYSSSGNGAKVNLAETLPGQLQPGDSGHDRRLRNHAVREGPLWLSRLHIRRPLLRSRTMSSSSTPHGWRWGLQCYKEHIGVFFGFYGSSSEEVGSSSVGSSSSSSSSNQATPNSRDSGSDTSTAILAIVSLPGSHRCDWPHRTAGSQSAPRPGPEFVGFLRDLRSRRRQGRQQSSAPYREVPPPDESTQPLTEDGQVNNSYGSLEADEVSCDDEDDEVVMDDELTSSVLRRNNGASV
uniref:Macrophage-expressed gene 1 protein n=1 Tax=Macrostomum lignano TaxID=282301 RepID=A0A1I8FEM2_9PLAT